MQAKCGIGLALHDWIRIAPVYGSGQTALQKLFYPKWSGEGLGPRLRGRDILVGASHDQYDLVYDVLTKEKNLSFPDLPGLLKSAKSDGKKMSALISHVGHWLNPNITPVGDRAKNKPQLRLDFLPGLLHQYGDAADDESVRLQKKILTYAMEHMTNFSCGVNVHFIQAFPAAGWNVYNARFDTTVWRGLLQLVRDYVGPIHRRQVIPQVNLRENTRGEGNSASGFLVEAMGFMKQHPMITQSASHFSEAAVNDLQESLRIWFERYSVLPQNPPPRSQPSGWLDKEIQEEAAGRMGGSYEGFTRISLDSSERDSDPSRPSPQDNGDTDISDSELPPAAELFRSLVGVPQDRRSVNQQTASTTTTRGRDRTSHMLDSSRQKHVWRIPTSSVVDARRSPELILAEGSGDYGQRQRQRGSWRSKPAAVSAR